MREHGDEGEEDAQNDHRQKGRRSGASRARSFTRPAPPAPVFQTVLSTDPHHGV